MPMLVAPIAAIIRVSCVGENIVGHLGSPAAPGVRQGFLEHALIAPGSVDLTITLIR